MDDLTTEAGRYRHCGPWETGGADQSVQASGGWDEGGALRSSFFLVMCSCRSGAGARRPRTRSVYSVFGTIVRTLYRPNEPRCTRLAWDRDGMRSDRLVCVHTGFEPLVSARLCVLPPGFFSRSSHGLFPVLMSHTAAWRCMSRLKRPVRRWASWSDSSPWVGFADSAGSGISLSRWRSDLSCRFPTHFCLRCQLRSITVSFGSFRFGRRWLRLWRRAGCWQPVG